MAARHSSKLPIIRGVRISRKALDLARQIGAYDPYDLVPINCGLHSGFPPCCVAFWWLLWQKLADLPPDEADEADCTGVEEILDEYRDSMHDMGVGETECIPCPACALAGKIVKAKKCRCSAKIRAWERQQEEAVAGMEGEGI